MLGPGDSIVHKTQAWTLQRGQLSAGSRWCDWEAGQALEVDRGSTFTKSQEGPVPLFVVSCLKYYFY